MLFLGRNKQAAKILLEYSKGGYLPLGHLTTFLTICKKLGIDNPEIVNEITDILESKKYGYQQLVGVVSKFE